MPAAGGATGVCPDSNRAAMQREESAVSGERADAETFQAMNDKLDSKPAGPLLAIAANTSWSLVNFRTNLLARLQEEGYRLVALVPEDEGVEGLRALGLDVVPISVQSRGVSITADLRLLARYWRALGKLKPAAFLGYTVKPNIYGTIAARLRGIPAVNNITGLGTGFGAGGALERIVSTLYRLALRQSRAVFFLNSEDRAIFVTRKLVRPEQAILLPGEGIDLEHFSPQPRTGPTELTFLLAARLIWEKGVGEYVAAARQLRARGKPMRFRLLGFVDPADKSAVPSSDLEAWEREGLVEFGGAASDVRPHIAAADCVVLPSWYKEGVPRVLMEAAAMERPIITTDAPGCRETVDDGQNGFLCEAASVDSLVEAMSKIAERSEDARRAMGRAGRAKMERRFDEELVIANILARLGDILRPRKREPRRKASGRLMKQRFPGRQYSP